MQRVLRPEPENVRFEIAAAFVSGYVGLKERR